MADSTYNAWSYCNYLKLKNTVSVIYVSVKTRI